MPKFSAHPVSLFAALGDPTRMAVVQTLCQGPQSVSALAKAHRMALPSFMQHLGLLERSGWIETHKEGRVRNCRIDPKALEAAGQWLERYRQLWEARFHELDKVVERMKRKERNR